MARDSQIHAPHHHTHDGGPITLPYEQQARPEESETGDGGKPQRWSAECITLPQLLAEYSLSVHRDRLFVRIDSAAAEDLIMKDGGLDYARGGYTPALFAWVRSGLCHSRTCLPVFLSCPPVFLSCLLVFLSCIPVFLALSVHLRYSRTLAACHSIASLRAGHLRACPAL